MRDFNNIKQWLIPMLKLKGYTINTFSKECRLSRAIIYFYMEDKYRPTPETIGKMCRVLNVPIEDGLSQYSPRKIGRPSLQ